jgi:hypothetical protein
MDNFDETLLKLVIASCELCPLAKRGECNPQCRFFELNQQLNGKRD